MLFLTPKHTEDLGVSSHLKDPAMRAKCLTEGQQSVNGLYDDSISQPGSTHHGFINHSFLRLILSIWLFNPFWHYLRSLKKLILQVTSSGTILLNLALKKNLKNDKKQAVRQVCDLFSMNFLGYVFSSIYSTYIYYIF